MAIFQNEAIRSLPEQVEKNKEDIKNINDILENIDPDQVATILSDIQALKAEQVVQNTAINTNTTNIGNNITAINNEKAERESVVGVNTAGNTYIKTATPNKQILMYNNGLVSITSNNNNVDIVAPSGFVRLSTDNASVRADEVNGVTLSTNESDVPNIVTLRPNGDFEVSNEHTLKFSNTGALTIDGQPIGGGGGGATLYQHNILVSKPDNTIYFHVQFITESSTPLTLATLEQYLYDKGYITQTNSLMITGKYNANIVSSIYSTSNTAINMQYIDTSDGYQIKTLNLTYQNVSLISDHVVQL